MSVTSQFLFPLSFFVFQLWKLSRYLYVESYFFCYFSLFSALKFRYMSQALLRVARENSSVVAVVGKGHLSGIKKNWMQPVEVICSLLIFVLRKGTCAFSPDCDFFFF